MRKVLLLVTLCCTFCLLPSLALAQNTPTFETFDDLLAYIDRIRAADAADAPALVEAMWEELRFRNWIPFVYGPDVAFMFRGEARTVAFPGDFNGWTPTAREALARRVGATDLWLLTMELPLNARVEYKIVLDGREWILDPANPRLVGGGFGPNNELRMPLYAATDDSLMRDDVTPGTLGDDVIIESAALGYSVAYRVYVPLGYDALGDLPVLYVLDGNDFANPEFGKMVNVLDNLIFDGRMVPVLAVFIDAREPGRPSNNRREREFLGNRDYATFVAEELVAQIDADYKTDPAARMIMGTSYGGAAAAYIGVLYPDVFSMVTGLSPALLAVPEIEPLYYNASTLPARYFIGTGAPMWDNFIPQDALDLVRAKGADVMFMWSMEGHSWGTWRAMLDEMLLFNFGKRITE